MALVLILLFLFGFVFAGFGSGGSSTKEITPPVKCSQHMKASSQGTGRCGPPPANP